MLEGLTLTASPDEEAFTATRPATMSSDTTVASVLSRSRLAPAEGYRLSDTETAKSLKRLTSRWRSSKRNASKRGALARDLWLQHPARRPSNCNSRTKRTDDHRHRRPLRRHSWWRCFASAPAATPCSTRASRMQRAAARKHNVSSGVCGYHRGVGVRFLYLLVLLLGVRRVATPKELEASHG